MIAIVTNFKKKIESISVLEKKKIEILKIQKSTKPYLASI